MASNKINGHDHDWIDKEKADEYLCAICRYVINSATKIGECEHRFCYSCISEYTKNVGDKIKCPCCVTPCYSEFFTSDLELTAQIKKLELRTKCGSQTSLNYLKDHVADCSTCESLIKSKIDEYENVKFSDEVKKRIRNRGDKYLDNVAKEKNIEIEKRDDGFHIKGSTDDKFDFKTKVITENSPGSRYARNRFDSDSDDDIGDLSSGLGMFLRAMMGGHGPDCNCANEPPSNRPSLNFMNHSPAITIARTPQMRDSLIRQSNPRILSDDGDGAEDQDNATGSATDGKDLQLNAYLGSHRDDDNFDKMVNLIINDNNSLNIKSPHMRVKDPRNGDTVVMAIIRKGRSDVLDNIPRSILTHRSDITNNNRETATHLAISRGDLVALKWLHKTLRLSTNTYNNGTRAINIPLLHLAFSYANIDVIKFLIREVKLSPHVIDASGQLPGHNEITLINGNNLRSITTKHRKCLEVLNIARELIKKN